MNILEQLLPKTGVGYFHLHYSGLEYLVYPVLCRVCTLLVSVAMVTAGITTFRSPHFNVRVKELSFRQLQMVLY